MNIRSLIPALLFAACAAPNPRRVEVSGLSEIYAPNIPSPRVDEERAGPDLDEPTPDEPDPFATTGELTLAIAMDIARTNAIQVLRAADAHLAAAADLRFAKTDTFSPHLSVGASRSRIIGRVQGTDGSFLDGIYKESANRGVVVRFDVDLAAATHGLDAARESVRAATWDWIASELAAETAAALLYHDLLEAQARVEITEAAVESASAYHALAKARFQAGAGLEADVLRAFAYLAEARQQRIEALAARGASSTRLAELLGLNPLRPLEPTDPLEPRDLVGDVAEIDLHSHPVLEAARARLAAAKAHATAQSSHWFLPELLFDAGFNDFGEEFGHLDGQDDLTAAISWDLSPSTFALADRAHADLLRARHDAEASQRQVEANLVRAQIFALAAVDLIETTAARVDAARAAVGLERTRHEVGDALLIELLDAEVSLRRAETAHAAAICSHNRTQHLLRQALGG